MQNRYSIEIKNLKKSYDNGRSFAVNDISFNVEKGSLFAFLGMNGAGKSTTINIICSILEKEYLLLIINLIIFKKHKTKKNNNKYFKYSYLFVFILFFCFFHKCFKFFFPPTIIDNFFCHCITISFYEQII